MSKTGKIYRCLFIAVLSLAISACAEEKKDKADLGVPATSTFELTALDTETTQIALKSILDKQQHLSMGAEVDYSIEEFYLSMARLTGQVLPPAGQPLNTIALFSQPTAGISQSLSQIVTLLDEVPMKQVHPDVLTSAQAGIFGCSEGQIEVTYSSNEAQQNGNGLITMEFIDCLRPSAGQSKITNGTITWNARLDATGTTATVTIGDGNQTLNSKDLIIQYYDDTGTLLQEFTTDMKINFVSTTQEQDVISQFHGNGLQSHIDLGAGIEYQTRISNLEYTRSFTMDDPYLSSNSDILLHGIIETSEDIYATELSPDQLIYQGYDNFAYRFEVDINDPVVSYETIEGKYIHQHTPAQPCEDGVYTVSTTVPLKRVNHLLTDEGSLVLNDIVTVEVVAGSSGLLTLSLPDQAPVDIVEDSTPDICLNP